VKGPDCIQKVDVILGHLNPDIARKTNEKSLRAQFGKDKERNCALLLHHSPKMNLGEIVFWFGGRVYPEVASNLPPMYLVVPKPI